MRTRTLYTVAGAAAVLAAAGLSIWAAGPDIAVLSPKGTVATQQRNLMIFVTLLMLLVVIPVFVLTFHIAWKYRAGNTKAVYTPDWDSNRKLEALWWGLPGLIILTISIVIWQSSHALDPFRPLTSSRAPITIQVVALQWKWLFIYPEQDIASINYLQIPVGTPVNFEITADAPMNSFWIPELGGQVYAMAGMTTQLHLVADKAGSFVGSSANLSGEGFAGMRFVAAASSDEDFVQWVSAVKQSSARLDMPTYENLARPSTASTLATYASTEEGLQRKIVGKYAGSTNHGSMDMTGNLPGMKETRSAACDTTASQPSPAGRNYHERFAAC